MARDVGIVGGSHRFKEMNKGGGRVRASERSSERRESEHPSEARWRCTFFVVVMTACEICCLLLLLLLLLHFLFPSLAISIYLLSCSVIDLSIDWPPDPSSICLPLTDF